MKVLAFETSCDETSVAVVDDFKVMSNVTRTQLEHSRFGGVVPEIAAREHLRYIYQMTKQALDESGSSLEDVEGIAVTYGPGLASSLLVGVVFAKTLSQALEKPLIGINHLEGHIFSVFIDHPELEPPFISLIVSGGHTELVLVEDYLKYELLGETLDDAVGEAYDKVAKMLGLSYPGGPIVDKLANEGDENFVKFPKPRIKKGKYNFSFSGIKTAVRNYIASKGEDFVRKHIKDICASFQRTVVDILLETTLKAVEDFKVDKVAVVGGVALNSLLRKEFPKHIPQVFFPSKQYCMDNAAMIGVAGAYRLSRGFRSSLDLPVEPSLRLV